MLYQLATTILLSLHLLLLLLQFIDAAVIAEYDPQFARFAFDHAAAAYSRNPLNCLSKYNGTYIVKQDTVSCDHFRDQCWYYVSASAEYVVIAFSGTRSKLQLTAEILANMAEPKVKFIAGGAVQRYFSLAFKSIWHSMWRTVKNIVTVNATRPVLFTGHSLGGAIASLASTQFAYFCNEKMLSMDIRLVTFGEPRAGNRDYAYAHDSLLPFSFRIVHGGDLVSHLPNCFLNLRTFTCISRFSFGPYHHGFEIWYPGNMTEKTSPYRICLGKPQDEDQTCSNSNYRHYNIRDHLFYFGEHVSEYGIAGCVPETLRKKYILKLSSNVFY